jgi:hypothetical protein
VPGAQRLQLGFCPGERGHARGREPNASRCSRASSSSSCCVPRGLRVAAAAASPSADEALPEEAGCIRESVSALLMLL